MKDNMGPAVLSFGVLALLTVGIVKVLEADELPRPEPSPPEPPKPAEPPKVEPPKVEPPKVEPPKGGGAPPPAPSAPPKPKEVVFLTSPVSLGKGKRYRARVRLSALQASMPGVEALIAHQFQALGFQDVSVVTGGVPEGWPAKAGEGDLEHCYFVEGVYGGESVTAPLPDPVELVWEA